MSSVADIQVFSIVQGVTSTPIRVEVGGGGEFDLDGATGIFVMIDASGVEIINAACVIDSAVEAHYDFQPGETDIEGTYWAQFRFSLSNGKTAKGPLPWAQIQITREVKSGAI